MSTKPRLSIVVSAFNEEECIGPLLKEIQSVMRESSIDYEILFIDDGSTDGTARVLAELAKHNEDVRVLTHIKNFGQSAGHATGFQHARGDVVITMDADGQNDPADIPKLFGALKDDISCICGVRRVRKDNLVRRVSTKIANGFRNTVTGDRVTDAGCAFRAIRKEALAEVIVFNGMHRFLATILRYQGHRVEEIDINHRPREFGYSKYGIANRAFRGIRDCFAMRWYRARALHQRRI